MPQYREVQRITSVPRATRVWQSLLKEKFLQCLNPVWGLPPEWFLLCTRLLLEKKSIAKSRNAITRSHLEKVPMIWAWNTQRTRKTQNSQNWGSLWTPFFSDLVGDGYREWQRGKHSVTTALIRVSSTVLDDGEHDGYWSCVLWWGMRSSPFLSIELAGYEKATIEGRELLVSWIPFIVEFSYSLPTSILHLGTCLSICPVLVCTYWNFIGTSGHLFRSKTQRLLGIAAP